MGVGLFSQVTAIAQEGIASSCMRGGLVGYKKNAFSKSGAALAQAAHGGGGVTVLRGVQEL